MSSMSVKNSILGEPGGIANESENIQESYLKLKSQPVHALGLAHAYIFPYSRLG